MEVNYSEAFSFPLFFYQIGQTQSKTTEKDIPEAKAGGRHGTGWCLLTQLMFQASCEVVLVFPRGHLSSCVSS